MQFKKADPEAGELAQQLKTPAAFPEDVGLIPSIHVATNNYFSSSPRGMYMVRRDTSRQNT